MNDFEKQKIEQDLLSKYSSSYNLLKGRIGLTAAPEFSPNSVQGVNDLANYLYNKGGLTQQERMIRDKRRTLDRAVLYSYQGAFVKKIIPEDIEVMEGEREKPPVRALINPNKLKQDYDDKIISVGYEHGFKPGDVFEWCNTNTNWLIYLQDLTELAYFRGDIRKCSYEISWKDEDGEHTSFAAIRGPVETKINYIQKHQVSIDEPNHSLNILMPKTEAAYNYFKRYSKFYLKQDSVCWRVEATDWISMPGILEINAVEYYSNQTEDDIENGIVGGLIVEPINPNPAYVERFIEGETFIKPKKEYHYHYTGDHFSTWSFDPSLPIVCSIDPRDNSKISIKWNSNVSGSFELIYDRYRKTIIVESLF